MNFKPKVSIIIPVYNGSRFLREAVDSALNQTYENIEVIVVNDGSSDEGQTESIAKSYGDKIKYFYKENGGVASALNLAIKKSEGDYISWLSHDDVYYANKIETQINFLSASPQDAVLYSDYEIINDKSKSQSIRKVEHIEPGQFRYFLMVSSPVHGCTVLIPKNYFDKYGLFNESMRTTQDNDLWFRFAEKIDFIHIPEVLIKSRHHEEQGTNTMKELHSTECDELFLGFIKSISKEEILLASGKPLGLSYAEIGFSFINSGFLNASRFSTGLSVENFFNQAFNNMILTLVLLCRIYMKTIFRRNSA